MKSFNVYRHPTQGLEAVKVGFSWPAFSFGVFWMPFKKLWGLTGAWLAAYVVLSVIEQLAGQSVAGRTQAFVYLALLIAYVALWLVPAFKGNEWREQNLKKRGYERIGTAQAQTPDAALAQVARST